MPSSAKKKQDNNDDTGSEYSPSLISPSTGVSNKSSQKLFSNEEYEQLCEVFKDLIHSKKTVSRPTVQKRLEGEPKLRHLLDKYELLQLADMIRTERRVSARSAKRKCKYFASNFTFS